MEIDNIEDLDIKTIMLDNNKILEINVESSELFLIFQDSLNINKLNKIKYFQNEKEILQIKKTIDTLLKEKKFSSKYDEKLGILTLTFKPTSNENDDFQITLNENQNLILENMFNQIPDFVNFKRYVKIFNKEYLGKENITFLTFFPSGYTITGSRDGKLKIYETFDIKKKYNEYKAHKSCIMYISIKDDNEFASCSDIEIKIFNIKKEGNEFIIENKLFIENAHNDVINKILYSENNILFSCSMDNYIKIWNLNNKDENIKIINENDNIFCFDFLNKENILISSGVYGTNIYDITINNNPFSITSNIKLTYENVICLSRFGITNMNDGKIIVCGNYINIISINKKEIFFRKKLEFTIWDSYFVKEDKELFFIGSSNIIVIISENDQSEINKYEVLMKIDEFKNKNYFRMINFGRNCYLIFSTCDDLFKFDYEDDENSMMM